MRWSGTLGSVYRRGMRRVGFLFLAALAAILLLPAVALAQVDVDAIAVQLRADGSYAEPGADVGSGAQGALDDASIPIYLVVLASDPGEDPSLTAQRIGELFGSGTFVVRTPDFIGIYSVDYDDATVEAALDDSLDGWRESNAAGIKALERELTGTGGFPFGTVIFGGIIALIGWGIFRGRKSSKLRPPNGSKSAGLRLASRPTTSQTTSSRCPTGSRWPRTRRRRSTTGMPTASSRKPRTRSR